LAEFETPSLAPIYGRNKYIEAKNEIHVVAVVVVDVVVHVAGVVVEAHKETSQIYIMIKRGAWEGSKHVRA
jgi:hypothetical protein